MNNVLFLKKNQMRFEKFREREREREREIGKNQICFCEDKK